MQHLLPVSGENVPQVQQACKRVGRDILEHLQGRLREISPRGAEEHGCLGQAELGVLPVKEASPVSRPPAVEVRVENIRTEHHGTPLRERFLRFRPKHGSRSRIPLEERMSPERHCKRNVGCTLPDDIECSAREPLVDRHFELRRSCEVPLPLLGELKASKA